MGRVKNDWQDRDYVLEWFGSKEGEAKRDYQWQMLGIIWIVFKHLPKMPGLANPLNADLLNHLPKMPELAKLVNTDLSKGFTVSHVLKSTTGLSRWPAM